jgi:hypothetical protein
MPRISIAACPWRQLALLAVVSAVANEARAAHPLITEDTGTQGTGGWQLELTAERGVDSAAGVTTRETAVTGVVAYGFAEKADIILTLPWQRVSVDAGAGAAVEQGGGDVGLDLKWRFYELDELSFALKPGLTMPTGDESRGLGAGKYAASLFLVTTIAPAPWAFHLHLGHTHNANVHGEREHRWHASFAGSYEVAGHTRLVLDLGANTNPDPTSDVRPAFLVVGLIHAFSRDLDFDFGFKKGVSDTETDRTWLVGITRRF